MNSPKPKKILLVISSLAGGGAERVVTLMLRYLDRRKFLPVLIIFKERNDYSDGLPADVKIICLKIQSNFNIAAIISSLSRVIQAERPELILSFLNDVNYFTIMASFFTRFKAPVLVSERNNPSHRLAETKRPWLHRLAVRCFYPRATAVICVSQGVKDDLVANFHLPPEKCLVQYNPCDISRIQNLAATKVDHPWFNQEAPLLLACGRLSKQKNYSLLLKATFLALKDIPLRLAILGKGEDLSRLKACAASLGISPQVAFLGFQDNPYKYMARATALVSSSAYEGFPNVLIEAMACGTPVISTRCPFGPEEIIEHGINGLLVPVNDEQALTRAMVDLLTNPARQRRLAAGGRKRADNFRAEKIVREYEGVFEKQMHSL
jgi:glycosyltransferase involved in cell wall biosynthesis